MPDAPSQEEPADDDEHERLARELNTIADVLSDLSRLLGECAEQLPGLAGGAHRRPGWNPAAAASDDGSTPGERVLFAFGQLYRLHRAGVLRVHPRALSVTDVARIIGVADAIEFSSEDRQGEHHHFGAEVIHVDLTQRFPWRLLGTWEWAAEREINSFWAEGWD